MHRKLNSGQILIESYHIGVYQILFCSNTNILLVSKIGKSHKPTRNEVALKKKYKKLITVYLEYGNAKYNFATDYFNMKFESKIATPKIQTTYWILNF